MLSCTLSQLCNGEKLHLAHFCCTLFPKDACEQPGHGRFCSLGFRLTAQPWVPAPPFLSPEDGKALEKHLEKQWTDSSSLQLVATHTSKIYLLQYGSGAVTSGVEKQKHGGRIKGRVSELGRARGNPEQ